MGQAYIPVYPVPSLRLAPAILPLLPLHPFLDTPVEELSLSCLIILLGSQ